MAEYGDYKKEIKTLGDLRTFVNETLKNIEDDYTFDIDDDLMGIDIILTANCDVSYSDKSFYWTANVNYVNDVKKVVEDRIKARHKIKAWDIVVKKPECIREVKSWKTFENYQNAMNKKYEFVYGVPNKIEWDNKQHLDYVGLLTEEEFNTLKEVVEEYGK